MGNLRFTRHIFILLRILSYVTSDYPCVCNYHPELNVFKTADVNGESIGYMHESNCKPQVLVQDLNRGWLAVAFENKLGYVNDDEDVEVLTCQGKPREEDILATTATSLPTKFTQTAPQPTEQWTKYITTLLTVTTIPETMLHINTTQETVPTTTSLPTTQFVQTSTKSTMQHTSNTTTIPTFTTLPVTMPSKNTTHETVTQTTSQSTSMFTQTTPEPMEQWATDITTLITVTTIPVTSPTIYTTQETGATHVTTHALLDPKLILVYGTSQCREDMVLSGHFCYKVTKNTSTVWDKAEADCQKDGGHLLSITNAFEQEYIYQLVRLMNISEPIWTGLNDRQQEENFTWSSGETSFYQSILNWKQGRLSSKSNEEDCVVLETNTYPMILDDTSCQLGYQYICKYHANTFTSTWKTVSSLTASPSVPSTASGNECISYHKGPVQRVENLCLEYVETPLPWYNARETCNKSNNGVLAEIHSVKEQEAITMFLKQHNINQNSWIGLYTVNTEGHYVWLSGTSLLYTHMEQDHQLFNRYLFSCFVIKPDGFWKAARCSGALEERHPFICMHVFGNRINNILIG